MMSFQLDIADIDPNMISFAEQEIPDLAVQNFVYEHLRYFCSKFFPIPSIMVRIEPDSIVAISRFIYLRIAKDLNLPTITAVIDKSSNQSVVKLLAESEKITLHDYSVIKASESFINSSWHVLFFERVFTKDEKKIFEEMIFIHFKSQDYLSIKEKDNAISHYDYSHSGKCVEFIGLTPSDNQMWASSLRQKLTDFHLKKNKIISYQGRKFDSMAI